MDVIMVLGWMDVEAGAWMTLVFPVVLFLLVLGWGWTLRQRLR